MNNNNIFKGLCFACKKTKFISRVDSWSGQKDNNGLWVRGSWRNTCNDCVKKFGWLPNRKANTCLKCKGKFIGRKVSTICNSCANPKKEVKKNG